MAVCDQCQAWTFGQMVRCVECRAADLRVIETTREARQRATLATRRARVLAEAKAKAKALVTRVAPVSEPAGPVAGHARPGEVMRRLHEIVVDGRTLRIERAPSGLNHYFVNDKEVDIEAYFAVTGRAQASRDDQLRLVRSA